MSISLTMFKMSNKYFLYKLSSTWEAVCSNKFKMSWMSSKDVQDSNLHSFLFKDYLVYFHKDGEWKMKNGCTRSAAVMETVVCVVFKTQFALPQVPLA